MRDTEGNSGYLANKSRKSERGGTRGGAATDTQTDRTKIPPRGLRANLDPVGLSGRRSRNMHLFIFVQFLLVLQSNLRRNVVLITEKRKRKI